MSIIDVEALNLKRARVHVEALTKFISIGNKLFGLGRPSPNSQHICLFPSWSGACVMTIVFCGLCKKLQMRMCLLCILGMDNGQLLNVLVSIKVCAADVWFGDLHLIYASCEKLKIYLSTIYLYVPVEWFVWSAWKRWPMWITQHTCKLILVHK